MTVIMKDNVPQESYGIKSDAEWKKGVEYNEDATLEDQLVYNGDAEYKEAPPRSMDCGAFLLDMLNPANTSKFMAQEHAID